MLTIVVQGALDRSLVRLKQRMVNGPSERGEIVPEEEEEDLG